MARKDTKSKAKKSTKARAGAAVKDAAVGVFSNIRYGKTVSVNFFKNNAWLLLVFVCVVLALMGMRYKTKTKMEQIKKLEKELVESESDKLREKAAYMSLIREQEMMRLVEKNNLGLIFQEQPPYDVTLYQE
ncbi:MAG: hypothetical protein J1F07_10290 [Muribaculaceae bacterium]|nr:hypothetical protein [Muribaculaceae bacterium]